MIRVKVKMVGIDQSAMCPVVIVTDMDENAFLPIVIGPAEASAIAMELEGIKPPRPITHDLMRNLLHSLDAQVDRIVISDLKDETYYATIMLKTVTGKLEIDARPSDAIALALRTKSPIFVAESVAARAMIANKQMDDNEAEEFRRFLDNLTPDDFRRNLQ